MDYITRIYLVRKCRKVMPNGYKKREDMIFKKIIITIFKMSS